ncbi:myosin heavy chain, striated muscle isoform X2 [Ictalurus punctatus]|uniref:Myosin heavy chain, striated muscle isoform X2 n=1 Tax=Ictalurus punctatus TaxID=7998 RepID=A0A9F7RNP5_ICTPU|nr:myosin heavy chain, striated muscle isoform X2 [Ictalurus punctatus]
MAACLVPDFPAVNIALEHLGELDKQLRAEGVSFSQEASHHLSKIADAIKELASRKAVHEELEVETIETGKLRHQLLSQHDDILAEISAAVAAARDANAAEMNQLQLEMANVVREIESMEKRRKLLEEENVLLLPEHQLLSASYTELTEQLNSQLSEKADTQITLNETRNEIRSTKEKIARVHSTRKDLQDNLIRERKQFEETKKMLEKEIDETMNAIQEQTKTNAELHKELNMALAELVKKEENVDELSNQISLLERSTVRLKTSQRKHAEQIEDKIEKSDELTKQKKLREKELRELREELNLQLLKLQENIGTVEREIEEEQKENSVRLEAISKLSSVFRAQRKKEDDALADQSNLSRELEKSKQRLDERFASIGKYKLQIIEMEEEMKELHEANKISVQMFQQNLVVLEGQLAKVKKNRAAFEVEREELCLQMETLKEQHEDNVRKLCSAISLDKTTYSELAEEKKKLKEHEVMSYLIEELTHRISRAEQERKQMEIKYNDEIQQLNVEAESISRARLDEEKELKDQETVLSKAEARFDADQSRHRTLKQQTTELKARKYHLELSIQEVKERTAAMLQPKEDLKKDLQTLRGNHMELLRSHAQQISATERSVYENGLMLEQANMENSRLHLVGQSRIEQMKEDIINARKEKEKHTQETGWMKEEVQCIYRSLVEAWIRDKLATEVHFLQQHVARNLQKKTRRFWKPCRRSCCRSRKGSSTLEASTAGWRRS